MIRSEILCSVWQPWHVATWPQRVSIERQVDLAVALGADAISMKGTNRRWIWGAEENFLKTSIFRKHSNDAMEREAKSRGLGTDLWCYVDLEHPIVHAQKIIEAVLRWNPRNVKIDIEGSKAMSYIANTGIFLRTLGTLRRHDGTRVKVYLQSYRRPDLHREKLDWRKFLTYKSQEGIYLVDGIAAQAYYSGTQDSVSDYGRMLRAYDDLEKNIGRRDLPWHVTLPTYKEWGWYPTPESLEKGIDFLRAELGARLVGVDYWRLGWLFEKLGIPVAEMLMGYDWGEEKPDPEPIPFEERPEPERWEIVGGDLRSRGVINGSN